MKKLILIMCVLNKDYFYLPSIDVQEYTRLIIKLPEDLYW